MLLSKEEKYKVVGEIYKITNTTNGKLYIGQTRSHRLNHNKYRPFGYLGRFKDHIHEANSNKKNQSRYLNSAILKYGIESFSCDKILTCHVSELDEQEERFIREYNSKYPNGYNLTNGGKGFTDVDGKFICLPDKLVKEPSTYNHRSDYTKQLISDRLKETLGSFNHREKMMRLTQKQHWTKKFDIFRDVVIGDDIDKYIHIIKNNTNNTEYIRVVIDKKKTTFVGKYQPIDTIKKRAKEFILELKEWQHTLMRETP